MNLYLVTDSSGQRLWVAYEDAESRIYVYVPNTGKFHLNVGISQDFFLDREYLYTPINVAQAERAMREGVGHLDARYLAWDIAYYEKDEAALPATQVLGRGLQPTVRQQASARADALVAAPAGQWLAWKAYPSSKKQLAYVAASDIRNGKIRALRKLGPVEAEIQHAGGQIQVMVRRRPS